MPREKRKYTYHFREKGEKKRYPTRPANAIFSTQKFKNRRKSQNPDEENVVNAFRPLVYEKDNSRRWYSNYKRAMDNMFGDQQQNIQFIFQNNNELSFIENDKDFTYE